MYSHILMPEQIMEKVKKLTPDQLNSLWYKVKHVEERIAVNPLEFYVPNEYQDKFEQSRAQVNLLSGGNMSGKTFSGSKRTVCHLLEYDPSGRTPKEWYQKFFKYKHIPKLMWFGAPSLALAYLMWEFDIKPKIPPDEFLKFDNKSYTAIMKNGNMLQLKSYDSNIEVWQSLPVDAVHLDEQSPRRIFDECLSRVNRKNGEVYITMTPLYFNSAWMLQEIVDRADAGDKNFAYFKMPLSANIHLTKGQLDMQTQAYKGTREEAARLYGEFLVFQGAIHPDFSSRNIIEPFQITEAHKYEYEFIRIFDLHTNSPNVCVWFMIKRDDPIVYVIQEYSYSGFIGDFAKTVLEMSRNLPISRNILDSSDSKSDKQLGTSLKTEMMKRGIVGTSGKRAHGPAVNIMNEYILAGKFFIFNICPDTIKSTKYHIWAEHRHNPAEKEPKETWKHDGTDHWIRNVHFCFMEMPIINGSRSEVEMERARKYSKHRGQPANYLTNDHQDTANYLTSSGGGANYLES